MIDEPCAVLVVAWESTAEAERSVFLKHADLVPKSLLATAIARAEAAEKEVEALGVYIKDMRENRINHDVQEKPVASLEPAETSSAPAPSAAPVEGLPAAYAALSGHNQSEMRRWVREGCPLQWKHFEAYALLQDCADFIAAAETTSPEGRQAWLAEVSPDWEKPQAAEGSRKWLSSQRMMAAIRNRL